MSLKVRAWTKDNMLFGPNARYATVVDGERAVKDFSPPFARLKAWLYVAARLRGHA